MNTNPESQLQSQLQALWGASCMPFSEGAREPWCHPCFQAALQRLEQLISIGASGLVHGPNGVGKTLLVDTFVHTLSQKGYRKIVLGHSTLTGSDLLRALCHALQLAPAMRRSDNVVQIQKALCENPSQWPLLVLEEAQNLSASALVEVRLLSHPQRLAQSFFSLLLVGDENLLPKLSPGIHRPLLSRLGFRLEIKPLPLEQASAYLKARLKEASIHQNPFEEPTQQLLLQASGGLPRLLNHLAQRCFEQAAAASSRSLTSDHVQAALDRLPWMPRLSPR